MNHERRLGVAFGQLGASGAVPVIRAREIIGSGLRGRLAIYKGSQSKLLSDCLSRYVDCVVGTRASPLLAKP